MPEQTEQNERDRLKRKPLRKHWYKQHITECPVCGSSRTEKERIYGKKPKNPYNYVQRYDWCNEFGGLY